MKKASKVDDLIAEKLGELIESLRALRDLGRRWTVAEERLAALARSQPKLTAALAARRAKPSPPRPATPAAAAASPAARAAAPAASTAPRPRGNPLVPQAPNLEAIREEMGDCRRCKLWKTRKNLVFGDGSPTAELMFVGEGPGADEDEQGLPFVGRAGKLLNDMIAAMGRQRGEVYIANIVKSRPPENREPEPDEAAACLPFLLMQIQVVRPRVIVCLGRVAVQRLLETTAPISRLRGQWQLYHDIRVMPTYHPAYLLRSPEAKKPAWQDLQLVMAELGWPLPKRKG
jgi:DNA polymerase